MFRTLLVVSLLLGAQAELFGAIPPHIKNVTPAGGAVNVRTDTTVTIKVGGTDMDPHIELVEAATGIQVPGKSEQTDRWDHETGASPRPPGWVGGYESGGIYVFRPGKRLKPQTRYEIRCRFSSQCPIVFTTGDEPRKKK